MPHKMSLVLRMNQLQTLSFVLTLFTSACLFAISTVVYSGRTDTGRSLHTQNMHPLAPQDMMNITSPTFPPEILQRARYIEFESLTQFESPFILAPPQSLTAILPILPATLHRTRDLIAPFLQPLEHVREVVIVCPDAIVSDVRHMLQMIFASLGSAGHPDVTLRPWQGYVETAVATLRAAVDCTTESVLILDETGLTDVSLPVRSTLLHPPIMTLPFGPKGLAIGPALSSVSLLGGNARPASYMLPPFVVPSSFVSAWGADAISNDPWLGLGKHIISSRLDGMGGMVLKFDLEAVTMPLFFQQNLAITAYEDPLPTSETSPKASKIALLPKFRSAPYFVFFLPTREDLRRLVPLICRMKTRHKRIRIRALVYAESNDAPRKLDWETEYFETYHCNVKYDIQTGLTPLAFGSNGSALLSRWLGTLPVNVVVALDGRDNLVSFLTSDQSATLLHNATVIHLPRFDLESTEWMSSLTLKEWKNWHHPRIDISIITKDRPESLLRLLASLANARYFGDRVDIRINVEQDCDLETLKIAEGMAWPFGRVLIHRRIVHGGLLPAVVESWYPSDDHSYGLLLEDDIELSPLFYAWIKMTLLRYRHGDLSNLTPHMFGISLYQQKNLELPLAGRQSFNPRLLFEKEGLPHPTIPYLSQIPCSWGAVYFPEHWREFHDYLAARLAETVLAIDATVVPRVRSNHWSRSWKKFFIELVYLRGYVMLYPNYDDFVSLSTNHLEVGSHVKQQSLAKRALFELPLMQLQEPRGSSQLLDMPSYMLPPLADLPVLNLTGSIASLGSLVEQGALRRNEILDCVSPTQSYDVLSLLCLEL